MDENATNYDRALSIVHTAQPKPTAGEAALVFAQLAVAEQMKRIADILEEFLITSRIPR